VTTPDRVSAAIESAIVDLTGQPQVGAAYAQAFIKRLAENAVTVAPAAEPTPDDVPVEVLSLARRIHEANGDPRMSTFRRVMAALGMCVEVTVTRDPDAPVAPNDEDEEPDDKTAHGYVVGCILDATEHHGDRAITLWSDDVHCTLTAASDVEVEDAPADEQWEVYELRRVTIPLAGAGAPEPAQDDEPGADRG